MEYYNNYIKYVESYRRAVTVIVRKRRIVAATAAMYLLRKKERNYKKKQFWVAPIFENRNEHSFFLVPKNA